MKVYDGPGGSVTTSLFGGMKLVPYASGREIRPPRWMRTRIAGLDAALRQAGFDIRSDPRASEAFWEYFLDLAGAAPGGLLHQTEAQTPLESTTRILVNEILTV